MQATPGTTLVAIGNYDGVHRGHQAIIGAAVGRAVEVGLEPLVLTFHPHPHEVLGGRPPQVLTPVTRRVELLCRCDPQLRVVVEPFTPALAELSAESFVRDILVGRLGAREVLVGVNFRFGHARQGDLALLRRLGPALGFTADAEPLHGDAEGTFSSSRARRAILDGDVRRAACVLGRPHALTGLCVAGDGRGRTIGVPTANLDGVPELLPPDGVYACVVDRVDAGGARALAWGVLNLGVRPTVGAGRSIEVHLLDFAESLYGLTLRVHLVDRLREERRFPSLEALTTQIAADVAAARGLLAAHERDPAAAGAWH